MSPYFTRVVSGWPLGHIYTSFPRLPQPGNHLGTRTYLVCAKLAHIPLLCADCRDSKIRGNEDGAADKGPVDEAALWCSEERQQQVDGNLARVVGAQQAGEEGVGWKLVALVLGAQFVEVGVVRVLEAVANQNGRYQEGGGAGSQRAVLVLCPDGDAVGDVVEEAEEPVGDPHGALARRRVGGRLEQAAHALEQHQGPDDLQLGAGGPDGQGEPPKDGTDDGDDIEVGEVVVGDLDGGGGVEQAVQ
jgi:hypothetical protein